MAQVTITIQGDADEVRKALWKLARRGRGPCGRRCGGFGPGRVQSDVEGTEATEEPEGRHGHRHRRWRRWAEAMARGGPMPGDWTAEELKQLWSEITPGARRILVELSSRPEGYPSEALQQALGMDGKAIGGTLSSVGVVWRKFGPRPPIYGLWGDLYRMHPGVASVIAALGQSEGPSPTA